MKKFTAIALASVLGATAIGTTYAVAQSSNDQGWGTRGSADSSRGFDRGEQTAWGKKGKRGGQRCSAEMTAKRAERQAAVDAFVSQNLGLNGDQIALYNAATQAKAAVAAQKAAACESGQRPDRSAMKAAMEPAKQAMDAFKGSLSPEQAATFDLVAPKGGKGKRGGDRWGQRGGDRVQNSMIEGQAPAAPNGFFNNATFSF